MPNIINETGLTTKTHDELRVELENKFKLIYGADINLDPSSPDAQMIMAFVQATMDNLDLLKQVFNSFDPDSAFGTTLDRRVGINGIQRQSGTYTITNITIVTNQAINLYGDNQLIEPAYTVSDNAGNKWVLMSTQNIPSAGTYSFAFRAFEVGAKLTTPNTINSPVTIVLGVESINNPTVLTSKGLDEEKDFNLKIRRQKSVSLASQGYLTGLLAALKNISGVVDAFVYENMTDAIDAYGVGGHSIWAVVSGTASDEEIAQAIYSKRNAGCGMTGDKLFLVTQADGSLFPIRWDNVVAQNVFIKFQADSLDGVNPPNIEAIISGLSALFVPGVNEKININDLATAVQLIDNNCLVTESGFSLAYNGVYTTTLQPSNRSKQFTISPSNIIVLPMLVAPALSQTTTFAVKTFKGIGGYGAMTYSIVVNNTGGSIDSVSGVYTAGSISAVDTIKAIDSLGNIATTTVTVV